MRIPGVKNLRRHNLKVDSQSGLQEPSSSFALSPLFLCAIKMKTRLTILVLLLCPFLETGAVSIPFNSSELTDSEIERESSSPDASQIGGVFKFPSCQVCKDVVTWVNNDIKDQRTHDCIQKAFRRACYVFPKLENCQERVQELSDKFISLLIEITDPQSVCEVLQACGTTEFLEATTPGPVNVENEVEGKKGKGCLQCQMVAHAIQNQLNDVEKEKEIDQWFIRNVCPRLATSLAQETCQSFIIEYGASIMQLIAMKAFDSKTLCQQELKLCSNDDEIPMVEIETATPQTLSIKLDFEMIKTEETCEMCVKAVGILDHLLASDVVETEVSHLASKVCNFMKEGGRKEQVFGHFSNNFSDYDECSVKL